MRQGKSLREKHLMSEPHGMKHAMCSPRQKVVCDLVPVVEQVVPKLHDRLIGIESGRRTYSEHATRMMALDFATTTGSLLLTAPASNVEY